MATYECKLCIYSTNDQSNYKKHEKSARHTKKIEESSKRNIEEPKGTSIGTKRNVEEPTTTGKEHKCKMCNKIYSTTGSLARHKKICPDKDKQETEKDKRIKELEQLAQEIETKNIKEKYKELEKEKRIWEEERRVYLRLIEGAGVLANKSMSTLSYIIANYNTAPKLDKVDNYGMIEYDNKNKKINLYDMIFTHQNKNTLHKYLGEFLVSMYKKENPEEQSVWVSDASRLTYIIRELIDKTPDWNIDKKGVNTKKCIINPFLDYIRIMLVKYNNKNALDKHLDDGIHRMKQRMDNLNLSSAIIFDIKNNILGPKILKYIAPYFHLTKVKIDKTDDIENDDKIEDDLTENSDDIESINESEYI